MTARRLFTVERAFAVRSVGMVLHPGVIASGEPGDGISVGEFVELRRPDGSTFQTVVQAILPARGPNDEDMRFPIVIPIDTVSSAPCGTDVWAITKR